MSELRSSPRIGSMLSLRSIRSAPWACCVFGTGVQRCQQLRRLRFVDHQRREARRTLQRRGVRSNPRALHVGLASVEAGRSVRPLFGECRAAENDSTVKADLRMVASTVPQQGLVADDELALTRQLRRVDISNGSRHRVFDAGVQRALELDRDQHLFQAADVARGGLDPAVEMPRRPRSPG